MALKKCFANISGTSSATGILKILIYRILTVLVKICTLTKFIKFVHKIKLHP